MDPFTILQLVMVITKALEAGVQISARVDALITTARNEGRDITQDELDALSAETDRLRADRREALARAASDPLPAPAEGP